MTTKTPEEMTAAELRAHLDGKPAPKAEPAATPKPEAKKAAPKKAKKTPAKKAAPKKAKKAAARKAKKAVKKVAKKAKAARKVKRALGSPRNSKTLEIARYMVTAKGPHMTSALAKKFKVRIVQIRRAAAFIKRLGGKLETKKSDKATGKPGRRAFVYTITKVPDALKK